MHSNTVAEKEVGENKRDVDVKAIFQAFRTGDPEELTEIGDYCLQDTVLVQKLVDKLDVVTQLFEMANITDTPVPYLMQKGQQIKCFSQIAKEARLNDFLIPIAEDREDGKFKGAIVLDPKIGIYDSPVAVLDFASLYPSIQVGYTICYTTIVLDPFVVDHLREVKESNEAAGGSKSDPILFNGITFDCIEWEESFWVYNPLGGERLEFTSIDDAKSIQPKKAIETSLEKKDGLWTMEDKQFQYFFAQKQPSVIPALQTKLKKNRKAVKGMMGPIEHSKSTDDQLRYRVLNGRQLAIKVSMNSIYGFTSAYMLNLMQLGACVTARGRQMIEMTKDFMENKFQRIALDTKWTRREVCTYYTPAGREIVVDNGSDGSDGSSSTGGVDLTGHIRKYPSAVEGASLCFGRELAIDVVGGDTDSVFCNFPKSDLAETISLCHKAEVVLTDVVFNRHPSKFLDVAHFITIN